LIGTKQGSAEYQAETPAIQFKTVYEAYNKNFSQLCETREDAESFCRSIGMTASTYLEITPRSIVCNLAYAKAETAKGDG
jgi:hypothetical protein